MSEVKRIYGEDTGSLTKEALENLKSMLQNDPKKAELYVYFLFNSCDEFCWRFNHMRPGGFYEIPHTPETQVDYDNINYTRFYAIGLTKNFGVTFEPKEGGLPVYMSDSFNKWYHFWHNYIEGLPREKWDKLNKTFSDGGDITPYLPEKAWNEE